MKFKIRATWGFGYEAFMRQYGEKLKVKGYKVGKRKGHAIIDINSLDELLKLQEDTCPEIIIGEENEKGLPKKCIEIYDGYRE